MTSGTEKETTDVKPLLVRLPVELHAQLRTQSFVTGESMSSIACRALAAWLEAAGRDELVAAVGSRTRDQYSAAFDKLAEL